MEFKANRLYYVLSKKFKCKFVRFFLFILTANLFYFLTGNSDAWLIIFSSISLIVYLLIDILSKPRKFEVYENYVSVKISIKIPTGHKNDYNTKRVNAKILDIDVIQHHASPFEQSNRVGRIVIHGRVVARDFCDDYVEAEHLPSYVEIHGVKDFESAVSVLKTTFPDAIFQEL